jgi:CII-binding regulator of phage lambda lysogenization HflD
MPDAFLKNNLSLVISFLVAVFTAGGIYSEFMSIKNELTTVHERLDKKILVINTLENRILDIEKQNEYERGFIDAKKKE